MSQIKTIVVLGETIVENKILDISTTLADSKYFLLQGTVYQSDMKPLPNAAIKIMKIDNTKTPQTYDLAGVTFSLEDGSYGISLLIEEEYMIIVYS